MLDSLLKDRYDNGRKILVDFSGFGHLLPHNYLVIAVWLFVACISGSIGRMEDYICMGKKNFCLLSRRAVVYGLINRNLSLPRLWTLYWKQGLTLLPAEDINLQPSLQLQTPNIGGRLQN